MTDSGASIASAAPKQEELFPIREVSRLTGVNPVTLRAWERRYGLIQPTRTESGHRLYSLADVEAVRSILAWIERGVSVSKVGKLLARSNAARLPVTPIHQDAASGEWNERRTQVRNAVSTLDEAELERVYGQVFSTYPLHVAFADVLMPVWQSLLLRQDEFGRGSEWVFFDSFLRARVLQRLQLSRNNQQQRVLLAPLPGQGRELELLVAGLLLGSGEVVVNVLGLGQPLAELALVCGKLQPQALVLFSNQPPADDLGQQLNRLALGLDCPMALAGETADLMSEELDGTPVACLGSEGRLMQRRLRQFLAGHLDT
ncbi:MerR family transcriptional regulator [Metapseudomonas lalkuanensis]|uniref:MerR family transcriptional regulator n=1 Tax=Metapseudomonas lalkuanensis TaxID=2604832 RepID=A0A5J6QTW1_9GAMM|nr:MerR family transcriptional regulator [Pseudomonas lalkuanensis]QEY65853.1 MerR family transcriptional regulator [Pseudomonas lalkuanensis]UCP00995.1 MerR family transcriptional regulator [Pseudomonas lalkuanensis]